MGASIDTDTAGWGLLTIRLIGGFTTISISSSSAVGRDGIGTDATDDRAVNTIVGLLTIITTIGLATRASSRAADIPFTSKWRDADTISSADRLAFNSSSLTSIDSRSTVGRSSASDAGTVSVTVGEVWTPCAGGAGAPSVGWVTGVAVINANAVSADWLSILVLGGSLGGSLGTSVLSCSTISVGSAVSADTINHAVSSGCTSTVGIDGTRSTNSSGNVTHLVVTEISGTAISIGSALDAVAVLVTVGESGSGCVCRTSSITSIRSNTSSSTFEGSSTDTSCPVTNVIGSSSRRSIQKGGSVLAVGIRFTVDTASVVLAIGSSGTLAIFSRSATLLSISAALISARVTLVIGGASTTARSLTDGDGRQKVGAERVVFGQKTTVRWCILDLARHAGSFVKSRALGGGFTSIEVSIGTNFCLSRWSIVVQGNFSLEPNVSVVIDGAIGLDSRGSTTDASPVKVTRRTANWSLTEGTGGRLTREHLIETVEASTVQFVTEIRTSETESGTSWDGVSVGWPHDWGLEERGSSGWGSEFATLTFTLGWVAQFLHQLRSFLRSGQRDANVFQTGVDISISVFSVGINRRESLTTPQVVGGSRDTSGDIGLFGTGLTITELTSWVLFAERKTSGEIAISVSSTTTERQAIARNFVISIRDTERRTRVLTGGSVGVLLTFTSDRVGSEHTFLSIFFGGRQTNESNGRLRKETHVSNAEWAIHLNGFSIRTDVAACSGRPDVTIVVIDSRNPLYFDKGRFFGFDHQRFDTLVGVEVNKEVALLSSLVNQL